METEKIVRFHHVEWKSGAALFLLFLTAFVILQTADLPYTVLRFGKITHGETLLDLTWNYSPKLVYQKLTNYGQEGRAYYFKMMLAVDLIFPILYGSALSQMLKLAIAWTFKNSKTLILLPWVPLLGTLADYAENGCIAVLLRTYPDEMPFVAELANICTLLKNFLVYGSFALLTAIFILGFLSKKKQ